jgi:hypothetical protein
LIFWLKAVRFTTPSRVPPVSIWRPCPLHRQHLLSLLLEPGQGLLLVHHLPLALGNAICHRLPDRPVEEPDEQHAAPTATSRCSRALMPRHQLL